MRIRLIVLFILVIFLGGVKAQVTKAINQNLWLSYVGVHPISKNLSLHAEVSWRRNELIRNPQQLLLRTGLIGNLGKGISIGGGYCYVITYPYGGMPAKSTFPENRIWQQFQVRKQVKHLEMVSRIRLEQRFVYQPTLQAGIWDAGQAVYSTRFRYMQRVSLPLSASVIKENVFYATAFDEIFYGFGRQIGKYHFDQNRVFAGLGYVFPKFGRMELGYFHQHIKRSSGTKIENNRTIQINFLPNFSLFNNK